MILFYQIIYTFISAVSELPALLEIHKYYKIYSPER